MLCILMQVNLLPLVKTLFDFLVYENVDFFQRNVLTLTTDAGDVYLTPSPLGPLNSSTVR